MQIGVIGSGIAGIGAAWYLSSRHRVDLFEKEPHYGGHAHTVDVQEEKQTCPIDIGFQVFNHATYPLLTRFFSELSLEIVDSNMSFSVYNPAEDFVYNSRGRGFFFQKRRVLSLDHWRFLFEIIRWSQNGLKMLRENSIPEGMTFAELLQPYSKEFQEHYAIPMVASIWSAPPRETQAFPARTFLEFFRNHGLLNLRDRPAWKTVRGCSREYVQRALQHISGRHFSNSPVEKVIRSKKSVEVYYREEGSSRLHRAEYDHVVIATHPPETLQILAAPTKEEKNILSNFKYQKNRVTLHTQSDLLHPSKRSWASWNYIISAPNGASRVNINYWTNLLQESPLTKDYFVTLNRLPSLRPKNIIYETTMSHPGYDTPSIQAQSEIETINGKQRVWFAGAWQRYGFHEDGLWSAKRIAESMP